MSWTAHTDGRVTHLIEKKGILVTLGVRELHDYHHVWSKLT